MLCVVCWWMSRPLGRVPDAVRFELSEAALALIRHATHDITQTVVVTDRPGRMLTEAGGASTDPREWLKQTALLRLISVIEAYVDAVSMHRMGLAIDQSNTLVAMLVSDFELVSSGTWQERHNTYEKYHGFSLKTCSGWDVILAGIHVRNCLMHGLGALTAKQRADTKLNVAVKPVDVTIGSNRMYLGRHTISKLGMACEGLIRHVDSSMPAST